MSAAPDMNGAEAVAELQQALESLHGPACVYFPIRHHSPACSWHLEQLIWSLKPSAILVEGPQSFTPMIPALLDSGTRTPVAFYTHFVDVERHLSPHTEHEPDLGPARFAAYYPFCDYSPELVALRTGQEVGAQLRFIDLDYAEQVIAQRGLRDRKTSQRIVTLMAEARMESSSYLRVLAQRCGCRDFNEMWDHLFESNFRSLSTEQFAREITTYCHFARREAAPEDLEADGTVARERAMAASVSQQLAQRSDSVGPVLVVTGGYHSAAIAGLVPLHLPPARPVVRSAASVQQALVRYSFEQLDALNGYSSGMPAPSFYNRVWRELKAENPAPHSTVAARFVVEIGAMTRKKDLQSALSAADEIAALKQARMLASLRGHTGPTREDLLDGMRSSFVKGSMDGDGALLFAIVNHVFTGNEVGKVPVSAGVPPLVTSFRREAELARLNIENSIKRQATLDIYRKEKHRRTSRFLHSVSFLSVPFGALVSGPDFVRGRKLESRQEIWEYVWTPLTEGALVEASIYGATIEDAAVNRLHETIARLEEDGSGRDASQAVTMLVQACRMGLHRHLGALLALISARIGSDPSFVGAISAANQLLLLWQSREPLEAHSLIEVPELLRAAYVRACYLVSGLAQCSEEELPGVLSALTSVRELLAAAEQQQLLDAELFWQSAHKLIDSPLPSHPPYSAVCGAMTGLLYSAGRLDESKLTELVAGYLVGATDWKRRAGFLRGLLRTCRELAWQCRQLIESLDTIIAGWSEAEFISAIPDLRLALADLTPRETFKVADLVASVHGREQLGDLVQSQVTEGQLELHRRITAGVLAVLDRDHLSGWIAGGES